MFTKHLLFFAIFISMNLCSEIRPLKENIALPMSTDSVLLVLQREDLSFDEQISIRYRCIALFDMQLLELTHQMNSKSIKKQLENNKYQELIKRFRDSREDLGNSAFLWSSMTSDISYETFISNLDEKSDPFVKNYMKVLKSQIETTGEFSIMSNELTSEDLSYCIGVANGFNEFQENHEKDRVDPDKLKKRWEIFFVDYSACIEKANIMARTYEDGYNGGAMTFEVYVRAIKEVVEPQIKACQDEFEPIRERLKKDQADSDKVNK